MVPFRPEDVPPSPSPSYHSPRPPSAPLRDVVGLWLFLRLITGRTPSEQRAVCSRCARLSFFPPRVIVLPPPFGLRPVPPTSGARSSSKFRQVFSLPFPSRDKPMAGYVPGWPGGSSLAGRDSNAIRGCALVEVQPLHGGTRLIWVWRTPYASLEPLGFVLRWLLSLTVRDAAHDKTQICEESSGPEITLDTRSSLGKTASGFSKPAGLYEYFPESLFSWRADDLLGRRAIAHWLAHARGVGGFLGFAGSWLHTRAREVIASPLAPSKARVRFDPSRSVPVHGVCGETPTGPSELWVDIGTTLCLPAWIRCLHLLLRPPYRCTSFPF